MKVAACYNIKGGVGKTATAVNLAYLASLEGLKVLVWDLDPQGASTFYFKVRPKMRGGGKKLMKSSGELAGVIKGTDFENLDLVPADFSLRHLDIHLDKKKKPAKRLGKLLEPLKSEYDLVLLDCPPSISLVSEAVFYASDALVIPIIPTPLSLRTLVQIEEFKETHSLASLKLMAFFSMADIRKTLHRKLMEEIREERDNVLDTIIPYRSEVERMGVHRSPLGAFAPKGAAWANYVKLWKEVKKGLYGR